LTPAFLLPKHKVPSPPSVQTGPSPYWGLSPFLSLTKMGRACPSYRPSPPDPLFFYSCPNSPLPDLRWFPLSAPVPSAPASFFRKWCWAPFSFFPVPPFLTTRLSRLILRYSSFVCFLASTFFAAVPQIFTMTWTGPVFLSHFSLKTGLFPCSPPSIIDFSPTGHRWLLSRFCSVSPGCLFSQMKRPPSVAVIITMRWCVCCNLPSVLRWTFCRHLFCSRT